MVKNGVLKLAQYLINQRQVLSSHLQRLLFFLRYEELKNQTTKGSYFAKNYNFEAWINGAANRQSCFYDFKNEPIVLKQTEIERLNKQYGAALEKWSRYGFYHLTKRAQQNQAWKAARHGLMANEVGLNRIIDESQPAFLEFDGEWK